MASRGHATWCAAPNCHNNRKKGYRLFSFPAENERCERWKINCRRADLMDKSAEYLRKNCGLCEVHFEKTQFMNPDNPKCRLVWNAVPTIFNVPNPPQTLTVSRPLPTRTETAPKKSRKRKLTSSNASFTDSTPSCSTQEPNSAGDTASSSTDAVIQSTDSVVSTPSSPPPGLPPVKVPKTESPGKRALRMKVRTLQQRCRRSDRKQAVQPSSSTKESQEKGKQESVEERKSRLLAELEEFLPPATHTFVSTQVRLSGRKKQGNRWTQSEKATALSLLHTSPKAYAMLRKLLNLPSVKTLRRTMREIQIYPGFNDNILTALKQKIAALPPEARVCSVVFDEMSIKEELSYNVEEDNIEGLEDFGNQRTQHAANHATVFMVRGLLVSWKQAIGYFLSSGPVSGNLLKSLLTRCLTRLTEIGLDIKTIICDQGSNNRKAVESLGVKEDRPFIIHEDKKVYVLYDPPHLLKNTRNNLKKTGFTVDGNNISWTYIEEFYKVDSRNAVRFAHKLSEKHIKLPGFSALSVKLAAQVLSHTVAAGISTMVTHSILPPEAVHTALFVERMDQLFNAFNSSTKTSPQKMRHAFSETSGHKEFLQECLSWLCLKVDSNSSRSLPSLSGWKISIRSLLMLWEDLHQQYSLKFLYTHRLNQDCIENLFSVIRGKGGHGDNPGPRQFRLYLRQVMVDSILLQSQTSNCIEDGDSFLLSLKNMQSMRQYTTPVQDTPDADEPPPPINDATLEALVFNLPASDLNLEEENTLFYIAGFIARKIRNKTCDGCEGVLTGQLTGSEKETLFSNKQYPDLAGDGLVVPSAQLTSTVELMEIVFKKSEQLLHMNKVKERFMLRLHKEAACLTCPSGTCKVGELVVTLFVTIRVHFTLKDNNRRFAAASGRKNRKLLKIQHK